MDNFSAETREDVMTAGDLGDYFCHRTAAEFRFRWEAAHPIPALGALVITLMAGFICTSLDLGVPAAALYCVGALLGARALFMVSQRGSEDVQHKQDKILHGIFPEETDSMVCARLRWWNHLTVPHHWARHSRIYDHQQHLKKRTAELSKEVDRLLAETEDNGQPVPHLPTIDIPAFAATLNSLASRGVEEARIATVTDDLLRTWEDLALHKALLLKVNDLTAKLERIEKLSVPVPDHPEGDVNELVATAIPMLTERRMLVHEVDQIAPDQFLGLVKA